MIIQGMTLQEMANYLVNLSPDQLQKLGQTHSVLNIDIREMDSLKREDLTFVEMWATAYFAINCSDDELRKIALDEEASEGRRLIAIASMRKRHLI